MPNTLSWESNSKETTNRVIIRAYIKSTTSSQMLNQPILVLVKARGALKRKDLLGPRREAQSASTRLIEVKRTFKKNNLINLKIIINEKCNNQMIKLS